MPPPGRRRGSVAPGRGSRGRGRGGRGDRSARQDVAARFEREEEDPAAQDGRFGDNDIVAEDEAASSSSDDDEPRNSNSYNSLLANFQQSAAEEPRRKKRKLSDRAQANGDTSKAQVHEPVVDTASVNDDPEEEEDEEEAQAVDPDDEQDDDVAEVVVDGDFMDDDEEDSGDPFETHFDHPDETEVASRLKKVKAGALQTKQIKSDVIGKLSEVGPVVETAAAAPKMPSIKSAKLKKRLIDPATTLLPKLTPLQKELAPGILEYKDLLFSGRTSENAEDLRRLACVHALNHLYKTRDRIIKNTSKLARDDTADLELRDQGFTRPKVLILLETRQMCVKYMDAITKLSAPEQQENRKRFQDTFSSTDAEDSRQDKPADFRELFEGNNDNEFRIGVKFTRKTIKYYSQFYASDIILASPLGLRRAMKDHEPKEFDYDFLSSIEVLIIDQADAMLQQNWSHVVFALSHLNRQPRNPHDGTDYSRIRTLQYLEDNSAHFRQTILFSAFLTPELNALSASHMRNIAGKIKASPTYPGAIENLPLSVRGSVKQTFTRLQSTSSVDPSTDPDDRFKYFTSAVLPTLKRHHKHTANTDEAPGILLFVPTYHDFVRLRNFFQSDPRCAHLAFGSISEYSTAKEVRRAQSHFYTGTHDVLLVSGRAHHFWRYARMQGTRRVVFYAMPDNPEWYREVVGWLDGVVQKGSGAEASVRCMFSRWEVLALERIVGTKRVGRMVKEGKEDVFEFQ